MSEKYNQQAAPNTITSEL